MYNSVSMAMAVREGYLRPVTMARPVEFCVLLDDNKVVEFCMCVYYFCRHLVKEGGVVLK